MRARGPRRSPRTPSRRSTLRRKAAGTPERPRRVPPHVHRSTRQRDREPERPPERLEERLLDEPERELLERPPLRLEEPRLDDPERDPPDREPDRLSSPRRLLEPRELDDRDDEPDDLLDERPPDDPPLPFAPPSCLFTVAQAARSAVFSERPRSR